MEYNRTPTHPITTFPSKITATFSSHLLIDVLLKSSITFVMSPPLWKCKTEDVQLWQSPEANDAVCFLRTQTQLI